MIEPDALKSTVTNQGKALSSVKPSQIAVGSGTSTGSLGAYVKLSNEITRFDVINSEKTGNEFYAFTSFDGAGLGGFVWREIGLYVKNPNGGSDILYAVSLLDEKRSVFMPDSKMTKWFDVSFYAKIADGVQWISTHQFIIDRWAVGDVRTMSHKLQEGKYLPCDGRVINLNDYPELKERWGYSV